MADMKFEGLTNFQKDLLDVATNKLPRQTFKLMRKSGTEARKIVVKHAKSKVKKGAAADNPDRKRYHKSFKRGKAFKDDEGKYVIRVYNSAPHAHLIEYGHRQVTKDGREVGFVPGKHVVAEGIQKFDDEFEQRISDWLDELLESGDL